MNTQEDVVLIVNGNKIKLDENMAKKLRKFAQRKEKPKGILDRLKGLGVKVKKWYRLRQIKKSVIPMEDFESVLEELSNPELSEKDKRQITDNLKDTIKRTADSYDELLKSTSLSDEDRKKLLEEKENRINELNEKLNEALGIELKEIEEPIVETAEPVQNETKDITVSEDDNNKMTEDEVEQNITEDAKEEPKVIEKEDENINIIEGPSMTILPQKSETVVPSKENIDEKQEVDYSKMTDEELETKLAEFKGEYQYRAHEENGLIEHDDDIVSEISKIEAELASRKDAKETSVEPETESIKLSDLAKFDSYAEYLMAYCKAERKPEDVAKFFTDLYEHDTRPQGVLSREEFVDERRKQIEKIRHDEEQEEIRGQKKRISEMKVKLESAEEKSKDLERQHEEAQTRLEEARSEIISLRQSITDLEAEVASKEAQNSALDTQVRSTSTSLTQAQDRIYTQERTISEQVEEIKQGKLQIASLEKELKNQKEETAAKEEELAKSQAKLASLMNNVTSQIKAAKDEAEDDIEKAVLRNFEEQVSKDVITEKKEGPKHLKKEETSKSTFVKPVIIGDEPTKNVEPIIISQPEPKLEIVRAHNPEIEDVVTEQEVSSEELKNKKDAIVQALKDSILEQPETTESKGITR